MIQLRGGLRGETVHTFSHFTEDIYICLINPDVAAMYLSQNSRKSLKAPASSLHRPAETTFSDSPPGLAEPQHHQRAVVHQPIPLPPAGLAVLSVSWSFVLSCDSIQDAMKLLPSFSVCFLPGVFTNVYLTVKSSLSTTATLNIRIENDIEHWPVSRMVFFFLYWNYEADYILKHRTWAFRGLLMLLRTFEDGSHYIVLNLAGMTAVSLMG